jgi:S1-C subfamily serine protease
MSGGYDDPFDDEAFRPAPPPQERTWLHPSEMSAAAQPSRRGPWRTAGLLAIGAIVVMATVTLVGKGMELSSHNDLDASGAAQLTASTDVAPTSTAIVTSIGVRASLGLTGYDATGGVRVDTCDPGSAARKAGLRHGDLVVRIGGSAVRNLAGLDALMTRFAPGQRVAIVALRNGATIKLAAVLDRAP